MANHKWTVRPGMLIATAFVAVTGVQCNNANCEDLRDELTVDRVNWETCKDNSDCILIGGNPKDCTGVLSCDLAVNKRSRLEAERRIASLPEETVDCMECASPNCPEGELTVCEATSHRCIIIKDVLDGGLTSVSYGTPVDQTGGSGPLSFEESAGTSASESP